MTRQVADSVLRTRNPGTGTLRFAKSILRTENPGTGILNPRPGIQNRWTQRRPNLMSRRALRSVSESGSPCSAPISLAQRIHGAIPMRTSRPRSSRAGPRQVAVHELRTRNPGPGIPGSQNGVFETANPGTGILESQVQARGTAGGPDSGFGLLRAVRRGVWPRSPAHSRAWLLPGAVRWPMRPGNCRACLAARLRGA